MGVLGDLTPEVKSKLERTEAQATRLVRLVSDLLDSEKISSGKFTYNKVPTRIVPLIEEGLASLAALAAEKDVCLTSEGIPDIVVEIDRDRITQVLVNLISNAIKFSPPDAKVTVSGKLDLNSFSVHVIDHGVGVPDEKKESIFERFEQGVILAQQGKGLDSSGLGLTIARTIIEGHGGKIGVWDTATGGSIFWFTIPIKSTI
jgi:signal transduction histidine kinase